jgi:hypothetical protein
MNLLTLVIIDHPILHTPLSHSHRSTQNPPNSSLVCPPPSHQHPPPHRASTNGVSCRLPGAGGGGDVAEVMFLAWLFVVETFLIPLLCLLVPCLGFSAALVLLVPFRKILNAFYAFLETFKLFKLRLAAIFARLTKCTNGQNNLPKCRWQFFSR